MNDAFSIKRSRRPGPAAAGVVARGLIALVVLTVPLLTWAAPYTGPFLEEMTWTELRDRIQAGTHTVLIPIGGTEQSGPQITLGKHNQRARVLAAQIASKLGNAVVAPVVAYVPEGAIDPPSAHMRFAGTISIPDAVFEATLEAAARSFCHHGLSQVVLLGDHGGYQRSLDQVAARFFRPAPDKPACRVLPLPEYYRITQSLYVSALKARGYSMAEIGEHAGLADTSLSLALTPESVRSELLAKTSGEKDGVRGDPRRASAELGQVGVQMIVDTSVAAIRRANQRDPMPAAAR